MATTTNKPDDPNSLTITYSRDAFNEFVNEQVNKSTNNPEYQDRGSWKGKGQGYDKEKDLPSVMRDTDADIAFYNAEVPTVAKEMQEEREGKPISGQDATQLMRLPTPAPVKRNTIAAGMEPKSPYSDELTQVITGLTPEAQSRKQQIAAQNDILQSILADAQVTTDREAQLARESILAKQTHAEVKRADSAGFIERSGMDTADINSMVNRAAMRRPELYEQMDAMQREIQAKSQSSFLDNPVGWVFDQITLGQDVKQYNMLAQQYNANTAYINSSSDAVTHAINSNSPKYAVMSNQEAQILADQQLEIAKGKKYKLQEEAVKLGIASEKDMQAVDQQLFQNKLSAESRGAAIEDRRWRMESEARKAAIDELLKEDLLKNRRDKAAALQKTAEEKAEVDKMVAAAFRSSGMNITTLDQLNKLPPKQKALAEKIWQSWDPNKGYSIMGATPVDVLTNLQSAGPGAFENEHQQKLMAYIQKISQTDEFRGAAGITAVDKEDEQTRKINLHIQKTIAGWQADPTRAGPTLPSMDEPWRIFDTVSLKDIAQNPSFKNNKVAIEANKLQSTLPTGTNVTPAMVIDRLAIMAKEDPTILNDIAKDGAAMYKDAISYTNKVFKPDRFGLPVQETFNLPLPTGTWGGKEFHNIASPSGWYSAILRTQVKQKITETLGGVMGPLNPGPGQGPVPLSIGGI
jgi:hypothetical protein